MDYAEAQRIVRERHGTPLAPGSAAEAEAIERFKRFFASFAPDKVARLLGETYAEDVWFDDTLKRIEGRAALAPYLAHSAAAVEDCRVLVHEVLCNGQGDYYFRWRMTIRFRRFARGRDTESIGISHVRFDRDGHVVLQQDYWNAADGLFQHVPLLGAAIRAIKRRV